MADDIGPDGTDASTPTTARRQRAPTITIDTSAVSTAPGQGQGSSPEQPTNEDRAHQGDSTNMERNTSIELRPTASFDSKESRPTSPHNVSSPATRAPTDPHNFLAVPGSRSRGNSLDSVTDEQSSTTVVGDTYASSPSNSSDGKHLEKPSMDVLDDEGALHPDPGTEATFQVENNNFAFSPGQLGKLFNPKNLAAFHALGGLVGIEKGLRTNRRTGLSIDEQKLEGMVSFEEAVSAASETPTDDSDIKGIQHSESYATVDGKRTESSFADRRRVYGENRLPEKKAKSIFQLAWMAYNDKVLILLTVAAVVSLALGLYQSLGVDHGKNAPPSLDWVEGVAISVAIIIVVAVGALNDWQKERQFVKLNKKKEDRYVKVVRSGRTQEISVYDILAGDVVLLEPGDLVPVDGVFIDGHNLKCDESSATGESDLLRKVAADEVFRALEAHEPHKKLDPFILSGSKVAEGVGSFLVTGVGQSSVYGKTMMSLQDENEVTPLQSKLNILAEYIAKLGGASALLLFVVLFIEFLVGLRDNHGSPEKKAQEFLRIFIVAVTVIVVAVPEGLPLAVTLALAFATTRMLKDNNLVRILRSCETMGNATTICSDKTGTLTQNKMTVVAGTAGAALRFGGRPMKATEQDDTAHDAKGKRAADSPPESGDDMPAKEFVESLSDDVTFLLKQSIAINSTAFEGEENGEPTFIGSKTETAMLTFARDYLGMGPISTERSNANIAQLVPFDSARKCMAAVVKLDSGRYRMYVKGASEILLAKATRILPDPTRAVTDIELENEKRDMLNQLITTYASRSLRTIGLLYKDYEQWPPANAKRQEDDPSQADFDAIFTDMVFLGVVGIQDPLRDGVPIAVQDCQKAGVFVRMVTGDNKMTAEAIAKDCGILVPGGLVMEGPIFRKLSRKRMDEVIPKLCVLARSSPEDKRMLVKRLKELGETVAVTGDGTNDAPALKTADVGFSMGIAGTEVAKEASAIILMDDNFSSIVKALLWGRAVNDAVKKFLQFQLTVNITAVLLTFVSAVASSDQQSVLTAVQLLWVNLIMDTFAALALATDPPTRGLLDRKPDPKSAPLISVNMWKMIIGQAIYQLVVTFILNFGGEHILGYKGQQLSSLVFNTFVWMQIFNEFNNRRLDNKFNIFEGIHRNYFFIFINCIMVGGQVMIVFIGGRAFSVKRLNGSQWAISLILGFISIPVGIIIRLIPDELVARAMPEMMKRQTKPMLAVEDDDHFEWNQGLLDIRDELTFIKRVRGGRLSSLKFKLQHPRETLLPASRNGSRSHSSLPQTPTNGSSTRRSADHRDPPTADAASAHSALPPTPDSRAPSTHASSNRKRTRSRSNSAFGPAAAMAGVIAGSIAGWSPIERRDGEGGPVPLHPQDDSSTQQQFARGGPVGSKAELEAVEGVSAHPDTAGADKVIVEDPQEHSMPLSQHVETTPAFVEGPFQGEPESAMVRREREEDEERKRGEGPGKST